MEQYLRNQNCEYVLTQERSRGFLSRACKTELFKQITTFIQSTYTLKANEDDIIEVCLAAIKLFPSIETAPSNVGGIVSISIIILIIYD